MGSRVGKEATTPNGNTIYGHILLDTRISAKGIQ